MTTAEILAKAADIIEPEGAWTQGFPKEHQDGTIGRCALNAIAHVARTQEDGPTWWDARSELAACLGIEYVTEWQDAPGRTQAEVVQALRDAAKAAS